MDRTERFYQIDRLLGERRVVPVDVFLETLGVSLATFKRDLEYMRDRLNAPITWDRERRGYCYDKAQQTERFELPGLWFNPSEIYALLTMQQLLHNLQPGLLAPHIEPLLARLTALLDRADVPAEAVSQRIRVLRHAARTVAPEHFERVAQAVLRRQKLHLVYRVRERDETQARVVSPQRLVHYRDNWYLDAWCHLRNGLRSFALDAIQQADVLEEPSDTIADATLDAELGAGYGIFSGQTVQHADLRFTPTRARWVANEIWHPAQQSHFEPDGSWRVLIPYSDDRELLMDILRHGGEVEVLAPAALRARIESILQSALSRYQPTC